MSRQACIVACVAGSLIGTEIGAQDSRCADCHLANPNAPETGHLIDWERSAHGRSGVGCDSCHGGDPTTFDRLRAHLGVLGSRNPASLAHRDHLPQTCGKCHPGPFVAFQKSRHFALLGEGDPAVPVCSTCHGEVAAHLLSPRALQAHCERCHREGGVAPAHAPLAARARELLEGVDEVRAMLHQASTSIRRIHDAERRARLEAELTQAAVPLHEAVDAGHAFVFEDLAERLRLARRRADALLDRLVNPTG
jgi:hypothetical protein